MNPSLAGLKRPPDDPRRALLFFTSHPVKEAARKRIGNGLARSQKVYREFLRHLLGVAREAQASVDFDIIIASDSLDAPNLDAASRALGFEHPLRQITHFGDSFEGKLGSAIQQSFADSYDQLVVVGNDCLDISPEVLSRAFSGIDARSVTIGPAQDGGFYLLGLSHFDPEMFRKIRWHSQSVFASLCENLRGCGKTIELLPTLGDIDSLQDLRAWISGAASAVQERLALCLQELLQFLNASKPYNPPFIASEHAEMCLWQIPPPLFCSAKQAA